MKHVSHEGENMINRDNNTTTPQFELGQVVSTPGCLAVLEESSQSPNEFLKRHLQLEQGDLGAEDHEFNEAALKDGGRILSAYKTSKGEIGRAHV